MLCYTCLFENLFEEFKRKSSFSKYLRKIKKIVSFHFFVLITVVLLNLFFKLDLWIVILVDAFVCLSAFIIYRKMISNAETDKNRMRQEYLKELEDLLCIEPFNVINSLSKLDELCTFLIYKNVSTLLYSNGKNKPFTLSISVFIFSSICSFFINELLILNDKGTVGIIMFFIIVSAIFFIIYMIRDTYTLFSFKNDEFYIEFLLILVREKKMQIIDSRNDSVYKKIKYLLKLGEFS